MAHCHGTMLCTDPLSAPFTECVFTMFSCKDKGSYEFIYKNILTRLFPMFTKFMAESSAKTTKFMYISAMHKYFSQVLSAVRIFAICRSLCTTHLIFEDPLFSEIMEKIAKRMDELVPGQQPDSVQKGQITKLNTEIDSRASDHDLKTDFKDLLKCIQASFQEQPTRQINPQEMFICIVFKRMTTCICVMNN